MSIEKNETRSRILKATWELLEANESAEVRMIDIARSAGISRQAVYLHFENRVDLLIATTKYIDDVKNVDDRLLASRTAKSGQERLLAFIDAWGNYIPEIYGVAKALINVRHCDEDACKAWDGRMNAVREGCEAAVKTLKDDQRLSKGLNVSTATDLLWMLLSVNNWELLTQQCGWTQQAYIKNMKSQALRILID